MAAPGAARSRSTRATHCSTVAVREPLLHRIELDAGAAAQVAGVEQRDPDAGIGRRRDERVGHRVGIGVRHAAGTVVEVVELTDAR